MKFEVGICLAGLVLALAPTDRQVDVGDHALRVRQLGEEGPTVVLESALGEGLGAWDRIVEPLSEFAQVVAYDRAGIGESEASSATRTPAHIAGELHAMLAALGANPPYVLVGHSAGGLYVRSFAAQFPDEVAGMLLVDATPERLGVELSALAPEAWAAEVAQLDDDYGRRPEGAPARWWDAALMEWKGIRPSATDGEALASTAPPATLPDVPVVVLTALQLPDKPEGLTQTPEGAEVWHALHAEWVAPLANAVHVTTRGSGHHIQRDQPALVLASLRELVRVVRDGGPLAAGPIRAAAQVARGANEGAR